MEEIKDGAALGDELLDALGLGLRFAEGLSVALPKDDGVEGKDE
jgi:hypothetical protein